MIYAAFIFLLLLGNTFAVVNSRDSAKNTDKVTNRRQASIFDSREYIPPVTESAVAYESARQRLYVGTTPVFPTAAPAYDYKPPGLLPPIDSDNGNQNYFSSEINKQSEVQQEYESHGEYVGTTPVFPTAAPGYDYKPQGLLPPLESDTDNSISSKNFFLSDLDRQSHSEQEQGYEGHREFVGTTPVFPTAAPGYDYKPPELQPPELDRNDLPPNFRQPTEQPDYALRRYVGTTPVFPTSAPAYDYKPPELQPPFEYDRDISISNKNYYLANPSYLPPPPPLYGPPPKPDYLPPKPEYLPPKPEYLPPRPRPPPPKPEYLQPNREYLPPRPPPPRPEYLPPKPEYLPPRPPPPRPEYLPPRPTPPPPPKPEYLPPKPEYLPPRPPPPPPLPPKLEYLPPKPEYLPPKPEYLPPKPQYLPPRPPPPPPPKPEYLPPKPQYLPPHPPPPPSPKPEYLPPKPQYLPPRPAPPPPKPEYLPPKLEYLPPRPPPPPPPPPKPEYLPPKPEYLPPPPKPTYLPPKPEYLPPQSEYLPPKPQYGPPATPDFHSSSKIRYETSFESQPNSLILSGNDNSQSNGHGQSNSLVPSPPSRPFISYDGWQPMKDGSSSKFLSGQKQYVDNYFGPPPPATNSFNQNGPSIQGGFYAEPPKSLLQQPSHTYAGPSLVQYHPQSPTQYSGDAHSVSYNSPHVNPSECNTQTDGQFGVPVSGCCGPSPDLSSHQVINQPPEFGIAYGVPSGKTIEGPKLSPRVPINFRPPVPSGLLESIGKAAQQGYQYEPIFRGQTYIPPAVPELPKQYSSSQPETYVDKNRLNSPFQQFQPPEKQFQSSDSQYQRDAQFKSHHLLNVQFNNPSTPAPSSSYELPSGPSSGPSGPSFGPYSSENSGFGGSSTAPSSHESEEQHDSHNPSFNGPTSNSQFASLQSSPSLYQAPEQKFNVAGGTSSANTNGQNFQDYQKPSSASNPHDYDPEVQSVVKSLGLSDESITPSQSIDVSSSYSSRQEIPIQGNHGSYTLQIQSADGSSGGIPHSQVLSEGLLQDIIAAIEQQPRRNRQSLYAKAESTQNAESDSMETAESDNVFYRSNSEQLKTAFSSNDISGAQLSAEVADNTKDDCKECKAGKRDIALYYKHTSNTTTSSTLNIDDNFVIQQLNSLDLDSNDRSISNSIYDIIKPSHFGLIYSSKSTTPSAAVISNSTEASGASSTLSEKSS